jgi:hypothetical protein
MKPEWVKIEGCIFQKRVCGPSQRSGHGDIFYDSGAEGRDGLLEGVRIDQPQQSETDGWVQSRCPGNIFFGRGNILTDLNEFEKDLRQTGQGNGGIDPFDYFWRLLQNNLIFLECYLGQGSGHFLHDKMPSYRLPGPAAATFQQVIPCRIQQLQSQLTTARFAFTGDNNPPLIGCTGAIILSCKKHPDR